MRVLLVDPPGRVMGLNLGLGYLAACLKKAGHQAWVIDFNNYRRDMPSKALETAIRTLSPDLLGFSVMSLTYDASADLIHHTRAVTPAPIVVGGVQATIDRDSLLRDAPEIDYLVVGEGEETLVDLMEALAKRKALAEVPGLVFRKDGQTVANPSRGFLRHLDELPFPDYSAMGAETLDRYPLLTSRGCPYRCIFCLAALASGRTWRPRKVGNVIEELRQAKERYKIRSFTVIDDNFTLNKRRAMEFCDRIIQERLGLPWECSNGVRADRVDQALVARMKEAGCFSVSLGVESFVPEVFAAVNKGESIEAIRQAAILFKKAGIKVTSFHIIGLPGDTYQRTMTSYHISKKMGFDRSVWQLLVPFPGTEMAKWVAENGNLHASYREGNSFGTVCFDTPDFPLAERRKAFMKLSFKNSIYPNDANKSDLANATDLLRFVLRYDPLGLPLHLSRMAYKVLRILFLGREKARAGITYDQEYLQLVG